MVIEKWLNITTYSPTYISENTGKEMFVSGSIKQDVNTEDSKPEEWKPMPSHPDLLTGWDLPSDVRPSDITTGPESEKDSPLLKSDQSVLEFNLPSPLESLSITEERTEVKKASMSIKLVWLTISANLFFTLKVKESMLLKLKEVFSTILPKYLYFDVVISNSCHCSSC